MREEQLPSAFPPDSTAHAFIHYFILVVSIYMKHVNICRAKRVSGQTSPRDEELSWQSVQ